MPDIKFGTDGWRAMMDKDFTPENVDRVAQAFAEYINAEIKKKDPGRAPRVAVGYDLRKNSENFAKSFAEVLIANDIDVFFTDRPCPTPAVSMHIVKGGYDAGIAITASHNPPGYNGIKIKNDFGGSAEKTITNAVEALIGKHAVKKKAFSPKNPAILNFNDKYLDFLKSYVNIELIRQSPYNVLIDSMHGTGARNIEQLLAGGKIRVTTVRGERDVTFGGVSPEPIPRYLGPSIELMKSGRFDLCICTDGDSDRVGGLRTGGEFISPGILLSLIMLHMVEDLKRTGSVVTTVSNTALIYRVARKLGLKVHETPVGFKYVCEIMRRENVLIGGEESGGIGFQDYLFERDGMLSGLLILEMMAMRKQSFEEILQSVWKEFGKLFYVRQDINYPNELKPRLFEYLSGHAPKTLEGHAVKEIKNADGYKIVLDDDSWLLFRLSGTEPILRVYSEASSQALAEALVAYGKELAFHLPVAR